MSTTTNTRLAAVLALLSVAGTFGGLAIHGYPDIGAGGKQIAQWALATDQHRFALGIGIEAMAMLLFLGFAGWLRSAARESGNGNDWLATAGFSAAGLYVVLGLVSNSVWWALLDSAHRGLSPLALAGMRDIAQHTYDTSLLCLGVFLVVAGYTLLVTRVLPRPASIAALVMGVGTVIPQTAQLAMIPVFVWIVALSVYLLVRPVAGATVRENSTAMGTRSAVTS